MDDPKRTPAMDEHGTGAINGSSLRVPDLRPFADQLMAIAQHLREGDFPSSPAAGNGRSSDQVEAKDPSRKRLDYAEMARHIYTTRRKREKIFGNPELFGEPAWDILLDLYIALVHEKPVSVSSACIGSASPPTTGLRWLGVLAEQGLIVREPDPDDHRRVLVRLTQQAAVAMDEYFASATAKAPSW